MQDSRMSLSSTKSLRFYENFPQNKSSEGNRKSSNPDVIPGERRMSDSAVTGHNRQRRRSKNSQELCELTSLSSTSSSLEKRPERPPKPHHVHRVSIGDPSLSISVPALPPKPPGPPKLPPILAKSRSSSSLSGPPQFEPKKPPTSRTVYINYPTLPPKGRERVKHVGGFECEFVEEPPKGIEWKCPICLQITKEPHQVDCCGYSFCKTCIYRVKVSRKSCPMCNRNHIDFSVFPNKGLQRNLYGFKVHCTNAKEGCTWIGELRQLSNHLRGDYYDDKIVNGCNYTDVQCHFCSKILKRIHLQEHKQKLCPKRPYTCTHCSDYSSTFEDVTGNHVMVCPNIAVLCPYKCGVLTARRDIEFHARSCGKTEVDCEFKAFGCNMRVARKYMQDHIIKSTKEHLELVATSQCEMKDELQAKELQVAELVETVTSQKTEIKALKSVQSRLKRALSQLQSLSGTPPIKVSINNFSKLRAEDGVWLSPPFYTHPGGYKMCLQIHVRPNHPGKPGFSMSVYLFLMKGEFDDGLSFPISITVALQLLSVNPRVESLKRDIVFHPNVSVLCNSRVTRGDMAKEGWGFVIGFSDDKRLAFYLCNDSMTFEIMSVRC